VPEPEASADFIQHLNPRTLEIVTPGASRACRGHAEGARPLFERRGYFALASDSTAGKLVFNCPITLKDTWASRARKG
jgi:glutaminyl-tRNA synthetase